MIERTLSKYLEFKLEMKERKKVVEASRVHSTAQHRIDKDYALSVLTSWQYP